MVHAVRVNGVDIPYSSILTEDRRLRVQAFLDPSEAGVKKFDVELAQPFRALEWYGPPLLSLDGYTLERHDLTVSKAVNQRIEWSGISMTPIIPEANDHLATPIAESIITPGPDTDSSMVNGKKELEFPAWKASLVPDNSSLEPPSPTPLVTAATVSPVATAQVRYRVIASQVTHRGAVASRLTRLDDRWHFTVQGRVEVESDSIDGVLMEIPLVIVSGLTCDRRVAFFPSPEAGDCFFSFSQIVDNRTSPLNSNSFRPCNPCVKKQ